MLEKIKELLNAIWQLIKKVFLKLINFIANIVSFFKDPSRLQKLQEEKDRIAVSIKENLANGNYQVINCLFDQATDQLVTPETDAEVISAEELDSETVENFGNKDMIVLK